MENTDIHQSGNKLESYVQIIRGAKEPKRAKNFVPRLKLKEGKLSEKNKRLILKFYDHCFSQGLSESRVLHYLQELRFLALLLKKDFDDAKGEDIEKVVRKLREAAMRSTPSTSSKSRSKVLQVARKMEDAYPEEVRWIKQQSETVTIGCPRKFSLKTRSRE
jgi:hypothetical protein